MGTDYSDLWAHKKAKAKIVWKDYSEVQQAILAAVSENELIAIVERVEELYAMDVSPISVTDEDWRAMTNDLIAKHDELHGLS